MSGKGSNRRPQEAPDEQVTDNWQRIFGSPKPAGLPLSESEIAEIGIAMILMGHVPPTEQAQADHKDVE